MHINIIRPILGLIVVALITACATTGFPPPKENLTKIIRDLSTDKTGRYVAHCSRNGKSWEISTIADQFNISCNPKEFDQGPFIFAFPKETPSCGEVRAPKERKYWLIDLESAGKHCVGFLRRVYDPDTSEIIITVYSEPELTRHGLPILSPDDFDRVLPKHSGVISFAASVPAESGWTVDKFAEQTECNSQELLYLNERLYSANDDTFLPRYIQIGDKLYTCWGLDPTVLKVPVKQ